VAVTNGYGNSISARARLGGSAGLLKDGTLPFSAAIVAVHPSFRTPSKHLALWPARNDGPVVTKGALRPRQHTVPLVQ